MTEDERRASTLEQRFTPVRVLRQVEAYRRILALHTNHEGFCEECPRVWPCDTAEALASIYGIEADR